MRRAVLGALLLVLLPVVLPAAAGQGAAERRLASIDGSLPADGARALHGLHVVQAFPFAGVLLLEGPAQAFDALAREPNVAGVYPEERLSANLDRARAADDADPADAAEAAWWPAGSNVTIAVVDSGIDAKHPGLAGRVVADVRIDRDGGVGPGIGDSDGHGTHVAGILAGSGAKSANARLHGLAPGARLASLDISDSFTTTSAVRAFEWIHDHRDADHIRVVSNSWGREKTDAHYDRADPVVRASDALVADGITVVFSAGNRGRDGASTLTSEATNPNVLSVGAADWQGRAESYSSRGPAKDASGQTLSWVKPDLVAPGTGIFSARTTERMPSGARTDEERYYVVMNGTSMAAPQVAAAAALLLDTQPGLSPAMVAAILTGTAKDLGPAGPDMATGAGLLDVGAALRAERALNVGAHEIVSEERLPIQASGSLVGVAGLVVLQAGAPQVPPSNVIRIPLAAPPGASRLAVTLSWSGTGSLSAFLVAPDGSRATLRQDAPNLLAIDTQIEDGAYAIEATPSSPGADASWELRGEMLVRHVKLADTPAEFHARAAHLSEPGFDLPAPATARIASVARSSPGLAMGVLALGAISIGLVFARRR